jgi:hypothetical protein
MSFVMSLQTIARLGFAPNLVSAWLTSFAIGVAMAIPSAILVARALGDWLAISPARRAARRRLFTLAATQRRARAGGWANATSPTGHQP